MNHRLISDMERDLSWWWEDLRGASARLRDYQRHLIACRQISPRPRASIALTLRQCVAARKMARHARHALASCRNNIKELSGNNLQ